MSALDDRLRSAAEAVHQQTERLSIPATADEPEHGAPDRTRSSRTLVAVAAGVVVVLIASVAVGVTRSGSHGGGGSNGGGGFTIEALAATIQQQSARVTITVTLQPSLSPGLQSGAANQYAFVEAGLVDFRRRVARIAIEEATGKGSPKQIGTELLLDGYVYTSITAANAASIPAEIRRTKRWLKATPRNSANPFSSLNPFDPLAGLQAHHVKLTDLGTTKLGKQTVHHYQGTERVPFTPPSSSGPPETLTATFDIYVDSHDRLVRLTSTTKQPGISEGSKAQIDFADYGVRVNVTAPPADQVYTAPDVPAHT
jgi:hypothetical protein